MKSVKKDDADKLMDMATELLSESDDKQSVELSEVKGVGVEQNVIKPKQKTIESRSASKAKLDDQKKRITKERWGKRIIAPFILIGKLIKAIFSIETYVRIIQSFEELLLVIFVDSLMLFIIVSLAYIIYSLIKFPVVMVRDWMCIVLLLVKIVGCTLVSVICIWAQSHVQVAEQQLKEASEETEE